MEAVTPIPKIRAGNEFTFVWSISRDGLAEDLTAPTITDLKLTVCVGGLCAERVEVPFTIVDTNKIRSSHLYERTGTYNLELTYKKAGVENEIDIEAFKIVARSAEASDSSDFIVSSDMAIGFKGDKGDPFTYDDLTPEQIAELQQPATDAITSIQEVELAVETAEGLRVQAELNRQTNTSTAISNAEQATDDANDAAILANEKADLANNAALLANEKAGLAATATTQANDARDGANSAAQSATNLVNSYATDLAAKELNANKQNSLAPDGTGTKFPTVDAVNEGLADTAGSLVAEYTYTGNKEVVVESIDYATYIFTSTAHGLVNGDVIVPALNLDNTLFARDVMPINVLQVATLFKVAEATENTFKITKADVVVQPVSHATVDFTKWHFERTPANFFEISITGLPTTLKRCRVEVTQYSANMCYYRCTPSALTYLAAKGLINQADVASCLNVAHYELLIDIVSKTVVTRGNFYRQRLASSSYDSQVLSFAGYVPSSTLTYIPDITLQFGYPAGAINGTSMKIYKL